MSVLLNTILLLGFASFASASSDIGALKLEKMKTLEGVSSDGLIEFTPKEYE